MVEPMSRDEQNPLDAGMAEGFGSHRGSSILKLIAAMGSPVREVNLRDPVEDHDTPVIRPGAKSSERYQMLGEIARGGVGVVLKGRDRDLGRDIAMKVLRPEHASRPEIMQRFVEEAQIGGQLQHPGIVPVYELGLQADRQPYFTMKLVKGKTLAGLLESRAGPDVDLPRFLRIFEKVCETIAYAHARGVIHRDLKPANIMVGSFGEVQVVDWGFAKVLAQGGVADERAPEDPNATVVRTIRSESEGSASVAGSVMGTPAYMPPEQALGQIEIVDERSDVFALGAILCEILTGEPPYVTSSGNLLVQAGSAQLEEARQRLEVCGAASELVSLVLLCLTVSQEQRPRDAGVLAQSITGHLVSVEERARQSEVAAAEAEVRVGEERKRRKLAIGLAAAILLTVVAVGGTYGWFAKRTLERVQRDTVAVKDALREATNAASEADAGGDVQLWSEAALHAERAWKLAQNLDPDSATAREARQTRIRIRSEARQAALDHDTVKELEETRVRRGDNLDFSQAERRYGEVFRRYGVDVDALTVEEAGGAIRDSRIAGDLCVALDAWAAARRRFSSDEAERSEHLVQVACAADADAWRNGLRRAVARRDAATLVSIAAGAEPGAMSPESVVLLASALAETINREAGVAFLREAHPHHPGDFWINYHLADWLGHQAEPRYDEAAAYFRVAMGVRPESVEARFQLGRMLSEGRVLED